MILSFLATDPVTLEVAKEAADFLSTKDLKWWFAGLFVLFVVTGVFIVRLLLKYHQQHLDGMTAQLTEQRAANTAERASNAALHDKLLSYITTDHQASMRAQQETASALNKLSEAIQNLKP